MNGSLADVGLPVMLAAAEFSRVTSGDGLGHLIFVVFCSVLIGVIVWWLGTLIFPRFGMPAKGMEIWGIFFILLAALVVINFIAGLMGHQFLPW